MLYNPNTHRRSIRLQEYDYSYTGAYFITAIVQNRYCLFGDIAAGTMQLNAMGNMVLEGWLDLPKHYTNIELDEFVIMPNHIHGIIIITDNDNNNTVGAIHESPLPTNELVGRPDIESPLPTNESVGRPDIELPLPIMERIKQRRQMLLPKIVGRFKMQSAKRINQHRNTSGVAVWQRNYYEHVIRNEQSLHRIRSYIRNNPLQWDMDNENPDR